MNTERTASEQPVNTTNKDKKDKKDKKEEPKTIVPTMQGPSSSTKENKKTLAIGVDLAKKWNEFAGKYNLPPVIGMTPGRTVHLNARLREPMFDFDVILRAISMSSFCLGEGGRHWKVSFDWIIKSAGNYMKIIEGNYFKQPKKTSEEELKDWATSNKKENTHDE